MKSIIAMLVPPLVVVRSTLYALPSSMRNVTYQFRALLKRYCLRRARGAPTDRAEAIPDCGDTGPAPPPEDPPWPNTAWRSGAATIVARTGRDTVSWDRENHQVLLARCSDGVESRPCSESDWDDLREGLKRVSY